MRKCMAGVVGGTRDEPAITQMRMCLPRSRGVLYALGLGNEKKEIRIAPSSAGRRHNNERKGICMSAKKHSGSDEVVDMELHCVTCGTRLYVSVPQADAVLASLERTGAAILICVCGQAQIIRRKLQRRND